MTKFDLKNKTVLITGATRGIGKAITKNFYDAGANLIITGTKQDGKNQLLDSIKNCFASLYTDRAISYRKSMNYTNDVTISVCIQKMVRSDLGSAGVAFSIDPESGFKDVILINSSFKTSNATK